VWIEPVGAQVMMTLFDLRISGAPFLVRHCERRQVALQSRVTRAALDCRAGYGGSQ
jgi:hypothetical protein